MYVGVYESNGRETRSFLFCFAAAVFAKLPFLPPSLQPGTHKCIYGVNLASGGAAVRDQNNTGTVETSSFLTPRKISVKRCVGRTSPKKQLTLRDGLLHVRKFVI